MKQINVIGTSGSGKSTLSKQLAEHLDVPYIELDALFWGPNWTMTPDEELFESLENQLTATDGWVLDGNYSRTTPIKWKYADTVIWVDYSFGRTLYQAIRRALWRSWSKTEIWPGTENRESFRELFSSDSIVWWTIKTYRKVKVRYETAFESGEYPHLEFVRLRSPRESERFLQDVESGSSTLRRGGR